MASQINVEFEKLKIDEKRGKPKPADRNFQLEIFIGFKSDLLTKDKMLKPRTDPIFNQIANRINPQMSAAAAHLAITRRIHEIFSDEEYIAPNSQVKEPETHEAEVLMNSDTDDFNEIYADSTVVIKLTDDDRKKLQIVRKKYQERSYLRLADGWTDVLFTILKRESLATCPFNFHRADIKNGEFRTIAKCRDCSATIDIKSKYTITEIHLKINKKDSHCKSVRRVTSHKAQILSQQMQSKSAYNIYLNQSEQIPDDAKQLPADFVSLKNLSKIKSRHNLAEGSAIHVLRTMKYSNNGAIKEVATDPFVVIFWSKQQVHCYAQTLNQCISLDATGGIVKNDAVFTDIRCCVPDSTAPHVFLYLISLKTNNGSSVPVGQMISAQQDSTRISYFFSRWLEDFKMPKEVTIDASMALKKSCASSFAGCLNIADYLSKCFEVLLGKNTSLPACYIRIDVAHFIKNLFRNKIVQSMKNAFFYLCCIGVIIKCDDFHLINEIVIHMVTIANGGENCEASHLTLTKIIKTHETQFINADDVDEFYLVNLADIDNERLVSSKKPTWFDEILTRVSLKIPLNPVQIDGLYNPKLNDFFKDVFDDLPLWSSVMNNHFNSKNQISTSNDTEARFSVIKNVLFKDIKLPVRPDTFVKVLLENVTSLAKLNRIMNNNVSLTYLDCSFHLSSHFDISFFSSIMKN